MKHDISGAAFFQLNDVIKITNNAEYFFHSS